MSEWDWTYKYVPHFNINNLRKHLFQEHVELDFNVQQHHLCSYVRLRKSKYDCYTVEKKTKITVLNFIIKWAVWFSSEKNVYNISYTKREVYDRSVHVYV